MRPFRRTLGCACPLTRCPLPHNTRGMSLVVTRLNVLLFALDWLWQPPWPISLKPLTPNRISHQAETRYPAVGSQGYGRVDQQRSLARFRLSLFRFSSSVKLDMSCANCVKMLSLSALVWLGVGPPSLQTNHACLLKCKVPGNKWYSEHMSALPVRCWRSCCVRSWC